MKEKIKKKSFWLALSGAVGLILQLVGLKVSVPYINQIISAVCAIFIILGLMTEDSGIEDINPEIEIKNDMKNSADIDSSQENKAGEEKSGE